jgi:hypothetical protein
MNNQAIDEELEEFFDESDGFDDDNDSFLPENLVEFDTGNDDFGLTEFEPIQFEPIQFEPIEPESPEIDFEIPDLNTTTFPELFNLLENGSLLSEFDIRLYELLTPVDSSRINILDDDFYILNNPDVPVDRERPEISVYFHYRRFGAQERRNPSPLFDSQYYLEQDPEVDSALANGEFQNDPLLHYIESGAEAGLDPNPFFDSDYYLEQNPDIQARGINPLEHYITFGWREGRRPSNNFDPNFYLDRYPDVELAGIDPLEHFITVGMEEGRMPVAEL